MNEKVFKVLKENMWYLGTFSNEPNVVPVSFTDISEDGKLEIGAIFLETTLENIQENGKVSIAVTDSESKEAYQIKGSAVIETEGYVFEKFSKYSEEMFGGSFPLMGVLVITPERIINESPDSKNRTEIPLYE